MKAFSPRIFAAAALGLGFGFAILPVAADSHLMTVFKDPSCGCCSAWAQEMEKIGYQIKIVNLEDMSQVKRQAGIPEALEGCHTAVLGDYILEGHVPVQALNKLLQEQPDIRGISTPGMPTGSLGMGYDANAEYTVYAFYSDPAQNPTPFYQAGK
ncbi:MAG: CopG family transcriptional regulator [Marinosulfonomonas sp.]|nr:MAG: CopG family transcriptional regulator [Marinosulfonomonas sp.]